MTLSAEQLARFDQWVSQLPPLSNATDQHNWRQAALQGYTAALRDGEGKDGWQPIETAPKDGTRILCFQPGNERAWNENAQDSTFRVDRFVNGSFRQECPESRYTHWMPLPAPPDAAIAAGEGV